MKNYLFICVVVLAIALLAVGQHPSAMAGSQPNSGRFQIIINPNIRADTFLLDTQTGKVWKPVTFTDVKGDPEVWRPENKFDNDAELAKWVLSQEPKDSATK